MISIIIEGAPPLLSFRGGLQVCKVLLRSMHMVKSCMYGKFLYKHYFPYVVRSTLLQVTRGRQTAQRGFLLSVLRRPFDPRYVWLKLSK